MNDMMKIDVSAIAHSMVGFIERGEWDSIGELNAADMRVWHNFDEVDMAWADAAPFLKLLRDSVGSMHYDDIRVTPLPDGWIQQHVLRLILKDGEICRMPAALFVTLNDQGLVHRIEEYLDSKQLATALPFLAA